MPRTRKSHPPSLKAKVAIEAIKAHKTTAQIAQMSARLRSTGGRSRRPPAYRRSLVTDASTCCNRSPWSATTGSIL
jgi:hypothetical protein